MRMVVATLAAVLVCCSVWAAEPSIEGDSIKLGPHQCVAYRLGDYVSGYDVHLFVGNTDDGSVEIPDASMLEILEIAMKQAGARFGGEWPKGLQYIYEGVTVLMDKKKIIVIACFVRDEKGI